MRLPWQKKIEKKKERIEELEQEVERVEDERDSLEKRFEAEKERRSKLAAEKQEAEKELNRLRDRLESLESQEEAREEEIENQEIGEKLDFEQAYRLLRKLGSLESPGKDLVTVFSGGKISKVDDFKGLKNTLSGDQVEFLSGRKSFVGFMDQDVGDIVLKTRPFFGSRWVLDDEFHVGEILDFIETEKTWVMVSAGKTRIFEEEKGVFHEVECLKSRVDREHGKGGYSQDRFERKRQEQVEEHLESVRDSIRSREKVCLLGSRDICKNLPGEFLGGFDPNLQPPEVFYNFRLIR